MADVDMTTSMPDVVQESVADLALKTYTLYFLVSATVLGVLLYAAIRKASKICCWNCMHGTRLSKDEKDDPRVPETMFRTPSILATLQDRYDKHKSSIVSRKSDAPSHGYAKTADIELANIAESDNADSEPAPKTFSDLIAETDENIRIHRYLDSLDTEDTAPGHLDEAQDTAPSQLDGAEDTAPGQLDEGEPQGENITVQVEVSDDEKGAVADSDDKLDFLDKDNGLSNYGSWSPSEDGTSQKPDNEINQIELESDYNIFAANSISSSSQGSLLSSTSDGAPLVSMDPSGDKRAGRYKKYKRPDSAVPTGTGLSTRSASAMSSRRTSKISDKY